MLPSFIDLWFFDFSPALLFMVMSDHRLQGPFQLSDVSTVLWVLLNPLRPHKSLGGQTFWQLSAYWFDKRTAICFFFFIKKGSFQISWQKEISWIYLSNHSCTIHVYCNIKENITAALLVCISVYFLQKTCLSKSCQKWQKKCTSSRNSQKYSPALAQAIQCDNWWRFSCQWNQYGWTHIHTLAIT